MSVRDRIVAMATSVNNLVKCSNCNILISDVLSFRQNKMDVVDTESMIWMRISGFTEEDIPTAKQLLYESVLPPEKKKLSRREYGKVQTVKSKNGTYTTLENSRLNMIIS